jgi:hypothetical protein
MRAVLAFALHRTTARAVLVAGVGGLVWTVYHAIKPGGRIPEANGGGTRAWIVLPMSSPLELALAALVAVVAAVAAAAIYRRRSIRR